jgi:hypothetical protein
VYGRTLWPAIAVDWWRLSGDGLRFSAVRYLNRFCAGMNGVAHGAGMKKSPAIEAGLLDIAWR